MSEINRVEIDEQLRNDARICKEGVESDFWKVCRRILMDLREQARDRYESVSPSDVAGVAESQAISKTVAVFISTIEDTAKLI